LVEMNEWPETGSGQIGENVGFWVVVTRGSAAAHAQWRTDRQRPEHVTLEAGEDVGRVLRRPQWQHMRVPPPADVFERAALRIFGRSVDARILAAAELLARLVAGGACLVERHFGPTADRQQLLFTEAEPLAPRAQTGRRYVEVQAAGVGELVGGSS
jgi:hypothetical protein